MKLSRSVRICIMLAITGSFFIVELAVGYVVGSLALIADAYHMLSDVLALVVALYSIKISKRSASQKYSYGWHRAEIIAALSNGVFLLALCLTIFMEAMGRFAKIEEIENPKLIVIVGSVGLACNVFGLFLFHEHGHGHSHGHAHGHDHHHESHQTSDTATPKEAQATNFPAPIPLSAQISRVSRPESLYGHPAQTRQAVVQEAQSYRVDVMTVEAEDNLEQGQTHLVADPGLRTSTKSQQPNLEVGKDEHAHNGSLNMKGVLLHILGDALGSVAVVVSGLVIWLTDGRWRFYLDPTLSVVIVLIILYSAIPLVRSAAFILLQGVPSSVSLDELRKAIQRIPDVLSLHELHVWQLSETRLIASVHIMVPKGHPYMSIARKVRAVLHGYGIHSATVQAEHDDHEEITNESTAPNKGCLIVCPPEALCGAKDTCCPPNKSLDTIQED